jgi:hypothetical protein
MQNAEVLESISQDESLGSVPGQRNGAHDIGAEQEPATIAAARPDPAKMSLSQEEAEICTLAGQIAAATSRFLRLLADFDRREGWGGAHVRSCAHWLSWRCGIDLRTAHEHLRVAHALTHLPTIHAAFDTGRLSYSKVRAITRIATPISENDLLDAALHAPAAHIERLVRGLRSAQRHSDTPDDLGLAPLPEPEPATSTITWEWDYDGNLTLTGKLTPDDGARLLAAVTRTTIEVDRTNTPEAGTEGDHHSAESDHPERPNDSTRPLDPESQRSAERPASASASKTRSPANLATALVAMAEWICSTSTVPTFAPAAEVIINVDLDTLLGTGDGAEAFHARSETGAHLDDGPALRASVLNRLLDNARLRIATIDRDGTILDIGATHRTPSTGQMHALWRRDHGCAVPGCGRTQFLHAHHVVYWSNGGLTVLDNLLLLCSEHHRALHEGVFTITAHGRQNFTFHLPDGTSIEPAPPIQGTLEDLTGQHPDIDADSISPDWDGSDLEPYAITAYILNWKYDLRQEHSATAASAETVDAC